MAGAKCLTKSELRSCVCPLRKKPSSKNAQQDGKHSESQYDLFHILSSHEFCNTEGDLYLENFESFGYGMNLHGTMYG